MYTWPNNLDLAPFQMEIRKQFTFSSSGEFTVLCLFLSDDAFSFSSF